MVITTHKLGGWDYYIHVNFSRLFSFPTTYGINKETKGGMALQSLKKLNIYFYIYIYYFKFGSKIIILSSLKKIKN